jgi:hypothetical protein
MVICNQKEKLKLTPHLLSLLSLENHNHDLNLNHDHQHRQNRNTDAQLSTPESATKARLSEADVGRGDGRLYVSPTFSSDYSGVVVLCVARLALESAFALVFALIREQRGGEVVNVAWDGWPGLPVDFCWSFSMDW